VIATPPAPPATGAGARLIEVLVVRLVEGTTRHSFGLLVSQVRALVRRQNAELRPTAEAAQRPPREEALHEDRWLPVYDLAEVLGVLAPWKMGRATAPRPYLLIIHTGAGSPVVLSVDDVTEIGVCRLDRIYPLPDWLRRRLHPPLVWGGIHGGDLALVQGEGDVVARSDLAGNAAGLLLLLDGALLPAARPV
jgi:chemotaxis signal transduction protein